VRKNTEKIENNAAFYKKDLRLTASEHRKNAIHIRSIFSIVPLELVFINVSSV